MANFANKGNAESEPLRLRTRTMSRKRFVLGR